MEASHQLGEAADPDQAELLRLECRERGLQLAAISDLALGNVLKATRGDVELAADALMMQPRPAWVREFVGP